MRKGKGWASRIGKNATKTKSRNIIGKIQYCKTNIILTTKIIFKHGEYWIR